MRKSVPFGTVVVTPIPNAQNPTTHDRIEADNRRWTSKSALIKLSSALEKSKMAQNNDSDDCVTALAPDVLSSDRTPDDVAIFSAPALGVVFHWWAESNRRWTARNDSKMLVVDRVVPHGGSHTLPVDSDRD